MAELEDAIRIAVEAHRGQVDKAGKPYILHVLRVMHTVVGEQAQMVAVLHDVVEDCEGWTLERLLDEGFDQAVVEGVDAVTRREGESYLAFIDRAKLSPLGRVVKLADLEDNMNVRRLPKVRSSDAKRLEKYRDAWEQLKMAGDEELV